MQDQPSSTSAPGPELARAICNKILSGPTFLAAPRLSRLLETCAAAYAPPGSEYTRPALSDDDRGELKRLRRKLDDYYSAEGAADPVRLDLSLSDGSIRFDITDPTANLTAWSTISLRTTPGPAEAASSRRSLILVALGLIAILAPGAWYLSTRLADPGQVRTLAILPLDDGRPIQLHDTTVPGITATLTLQLSHVSQFRTVAYTSALPFAYNAREMDALRRALNADAIVEGKLTPSETTIDGELWMRRTSDGRRVWQSRFTAPRDNLLPALDKAAQDIAVRLGAPLPAPARLALKSGKPSREAVDNLLLARATHQETPQEMQKALRALQAAVKSDPTFAPAHAALADIWARIVQLEFRPVAEASNSTREVATAALAVDPNLAEAHLALGVAAAFGQWDWKTARSEFDRALALRPSYPYALARLGQLEQTLGNTQAAVARLEQARALDPSRQSLNVELGFAYAFAGQHDKALALMDELEKLDPEYRVLRLVRGMAYLGSKQYDRATAHLELLTNLRTWSAPGWAIAAPAAAFDGRKEEARKGLDSLRNNPNIAKPDPVILAGILLSLGDDAEAYKLLNEAVAARNPLLLTLPVNPIFAPSRGNPQFQEIVRKLQARR